MQNFRQPSTAHLPILTQALLCGQPSLPLQSVKLPAGLAHLSAAGADASQHAHAHAHAHAVLPHYRTPSPPATGDSKHHNADEHSDSDLSSTSTRTYSSSTSTRNYSGGPERGSIECTAMSPGDAKEHAKNTIFPRRKAGQKARLNSQPVVLNMATLSQVCGGVGGWEGWCCVAEVSHTSFFFSALFSRTHTHCPLALYFYFLHSHFVFTRTESFAANWT